MREMIKDPRQPTKVQFQSSQTYNLIFIQFTTFISTCTVYVEFTFYGILSKRISIKW